MGPARILIRPCAALSEPPREPAPARAGCRPPPLELPGVPIEGGTVTARGFAYGIFEVTG